jgi:hypothetical protein
VIPLDAVTFEVVSTTAHIPFNDDAPIEYSEDVTTHLDDTAGKYGGGNA